MKNALEMQNDIDSLCTEIRSDSVSAGKAKEINKAMRNMISLQSVRIAYAKSRMEVPQIEFLNCK